MFINTDSGPHLCICLHVNLDRPSIKINKIFVRDTLISRGYLSSYLYLYNIPFIGLISIRELVQLKGNSCGPTNKVYYFQPIRLSLIILSQYRLKGN
jgi:hypothetical protein